MPPRFRKGLCLGADRAGDIYAGVCRDHQNRRAQSDTQDGIEYWHARDLQELLGYATWRRFVGALHRTITSCENAGYEPDDHFVGVNKKVTLGSRAERVADERSFGRIRSKGDQALFGGRTTQDMKDRLGVPKSRPLADFLPTITIKAKDFANEITNFNIKKDDLSAEPAITDEHTKNNADVRRVLTERGIVPESLPPSEDIKKVERRVASEQKKLPKGVKPLDQSDSGE